MAINLVSLVSQFLTPQLIGGLARALGINEAVAQKLAAAAIPAILASLATAAAAPGGAQKVSDAVSRSDPDILTKLTGAITGGNTRFLNEGGTLLSGLLGGGAPLEPNRGAEPVFRRSAARDAGAARHDYSCDRRHHRSAGSFELVGPIGDFFDAQQSEKRNLGRASARAFESARRFRASGRSRRGGRRRDPNRSVDGFERGKRRKLDG